MGLSGGRGGGSGESPVEFGLTVEQEVAVGDDLVIGFKPCEHFDEFVAAPSQGHSLTFVTSASDINEYDGFAAGLQHGGARHGEHRLGFHGHSCLTRDTVKKGAAAVHDGIGQVHADLGGAGGFIQVGIYE